VSIDSERVDRPLSDFERFCPTPEVGNVHGGSEIVTTGREAGLVTQRASGDGETLGVRGSSRANLNSGPQAR
jgi:hypothetical protein